MNRILPLLVFLWRINSAAFTEQGCVIELECEECVPENMPLVTSHRAVNGSVRAAEGDELALSCGPGRFLAAPRAAALAVVCEAGRYRLRHDNSLRHLLELGCQEDIFEDVLHSVEHCSPPLQGRAYQMHEESGGTRHVATVCFDADGGAPVWAHCTNAPRNALALPAHEERAALLTLLGNFNHMFDSRTRLDAERLFSDDARLTRRVREQFRPDGVSFAGQTLTSAPLLAPAYLEENARAARFVSSRVAVWRGVASANLRHLQRDVASLLRAAPRRPLRVYSGTHGVLTLRAGAGRRPVTLRPGRFPVPRYLWTVVHDERAHRALALVLLNDPLVAVSEVRTAVFCPSACGEARWLRELQRHRNYEVPSMGLVFCCSLSDFAAAVPSFPKDAVRDVPAGAAGMLTRIPQPHE